MKVRAIKSTSRIIKGELYDVRSLWNATNRNRTAISLKVFSGTLSTSSFTLPDGSPLPNIDWQDAPAVQVQRLKPEEVQVGDVLVCMSDNFVNFVKDGKYKVAEIRKIEQGSTHKWYKYTMKLEGYNRFIAINSWNFRRLTKDESRDLNLSGVFGEEVNTKVDKSVRKIDQIENRNLTLMTLLSKSILDKNRHKLSIVEWATTMIGKQMKLTPDDYNDLLKMSLEDILKLINND